MIQIPRFSRLLSENCDLQAALHILANILLIAAFLLSSSCESKKKIFPEDQSLRDNYNQIEEEMTEEQVDALLIGYKSVTTTGDIKEIDNGVRFKRKSAYSIGFLDRAEEGDSVLHVYFDQDGYVVGKTITAIQK